MEYSTADTNPISEEDQEGHEYYEYYEYYNISHLLADREAILPVINALSTCGVTVGIGAILFNLAFLIAILCIKPTSKSYRKYIRNLSVSDLFGSLSFIIIINYPQGILGLISTNDFAFIRALPYVFRSIPWMFFTEYLLTLSCLSVTQYIAVCKPWKYNELVTDRIVTWSIVLTWIISSLHLIIPLVIIFTLAVISHGERDPMPILHQVASTEIVVWLFIFILSIASNIFFTILVYRKLSMLQLHNRAVSTQSKLPSSIKSKQEIFLTLTLLLLASIFCRLPFPVIGIIGFTAGTSIDYKTWEILNASLALLLYINFLVDPLIYFLRTRDIRHGIHNAGRWMSLRLYGVNATYLEGHRRLLYGSIEQYELQSRIPPNKVLPLSQNGHGLTNQSP